MYRGENSIDVKIFDHFLFRGGGVKNQPQGLCTLQHFIRFNQINRNVYVLTYKSYRFNIESAR